MAIAGFGKSPLPFDMFELQRAADEARRAEKMENIYHRGQDLIWSGRFMSADEALAAGYVSRVVPADDLMQETLALAREYAKGPAVAIQLAKSLAYRSADTTLEAGLHLAQLAMTIAQTTEDAREGPRAFVEKREARFAGR